MPEVPMMSIKECIEFKEKYPHFTLTVGELKKYIADLPDEGLVFIERIRDEYIDKNWKAYDIDVQDHDTFVQSSQIFSTDRFNAFICGHY